MERYERAGPKTKKEMETALKGLFGEIHRTQRELANMQKNHDDYYGLRYDSPKFEVKKKRRNEEVEDRSLLDLIKEAEDANSNAVKALDNFFEFFQNNSKAIKGCELPTEIDKLLEEVYNPEVDEEQTVIKSYLKKHFSTLSRLVTFLNIGLIVHPTYKIKEGGEERINSELLNSMVFKGLSPRSLTAMNAKKEELEGK